MTKKPAFVLVLAACVVGTAHDASAQLDPLLFLKRTQPNVLLAVETSNRMQRDINGDYLDANVYSRTGALWEPTLGVTPLNTTSRYRRKYIRLQHTDPALGGDKFSADVIQVVTDQNAAYATFDEGTKLTIIRRALTEAINRNRTVARFGLLRMRQNNPRLGAPSNEGPVKVASATQQDPTDDGGNGKWKITRPIVDSSNGSIAAVTAPLVAPDAANANTSILSTLALNVGQAGALTPGGRDGNFVTDAPIDNMLDDARAEAVRLANADTQCRNTVVVLLVGGGEGNTTGEDIAAKANQFLNIGANHRVPIHVIALAPPAGDVASLRAVATNSGGVYTEITPAMVASITPGQPIPAIVRAVNFAVQHAFTAQSDLDTDPTPVFPLGPYTEHQVTSPIVGTVNLVDAEDATGVSLPLTSITNPKTGALIPQRSNVMVTTGFSLPGFEAKLRGFRVYKPEPDPKRSSGYKFVADGTPLWTAHAPAPADRNIYTALPDGTLVAFTAANAAVLSPYLRDPDPAGLINFIRSQPLGAPVSSTPAIMDPPSLDPPPDAAYPGFAATNKNRRSIIWIGLNDGMLHAIDARLGVEGWAFIPHNLLPKLRALRNGQPVGDFRYFVDSSPKVADVKIDGQWRTYLVIGEGAGGTFYQTFDVTLDNMESVVKPDDDVKANVLTYFSDPTRVKLKWAFPRYSSFDATIAPFGDVSATASAIEKTVGETWSDPAVGQIEGPQGPFTVLTASGFLRHSVQQQANRGGARGGTTFYLLDAKTGAVLDSRDVGSDGKGETIDNCGAINDCSQIKNALQADPVATGPADSRFINRAYIGDLDGALWRFNVALNASKQPVINGAPVKLITTATTGSTGGLAETRPIFSSMASVTVGGTQQYLFVGTGSDLLPSGSKASQQIMAVILDNGASGSMTAAIPLEKIDGLAGDEKVTAFPAVAGDIVFFSTTTLFPATPCTAPTGNLYAFTFIGGPAYDTNGDGRVTSSGDSTRIRAAAGRATAPFITDQHLFFGVGDKLEMFGDPEDFNNGVGQVGVRILSWREVK